MKTTKTLLSEKIATLEHEKSVLQTENTNLKKQIENLKQQLASFSPEQQGLDETAIKFQDSFRRWWRDWLGIYCRIAWYFEECSQKMIFRGRWHGAGKSRSRFDDTARQRTDIDHGFRLVRFRLWRAANAFWKQTSALNKLDSIIQEVARGNRAGQAA